MSDSRRPEESRDVRWFHRLLNAFPPEFRGDFGGEMEQVFQQQRREAGRQGRAGVLRLWLETLAGIFRTAPREHVEMLRQDGGYALRMMRKNPGFTALAVLTLALGIGANTAIFSVVHGVLLKPLPYSDEDRIVLLRQQAPRANIHQLAFSEKELLDYRAASQSLSDLVEYHAMSFILLGGEEPLRVQTGVVSWNYFDFLGVQPLHGRAFRQDDEKHGAEAVLMLSHEFWQRRFHADPNIVGRVFQMNNRPHTAIGVLPPFPQFPETNDVYMPVSACPFRSSDQTRGDRTARMVRLFGRMKPGVNLPQAQADVAGVAARFPKDHPDAYGLYQGFTATATALREELTRHARRTFLLLLGAVGFVLLIACANVANLLLARMAGRERELAIRAALGAGRVRLLRQLLTESSLLALVGGALGLALASSSLGLLKSFAARFTPRAGEIQLDPPVLLFTLGLSLLTGMIFGSLPALAARRDPMAALHEEGGRKTAGPARHRARSLLVVAQVALSFLLMSGAGLMLRSLWNLEKVNPGFNPENVLMGRISLDWTRYGDNEQLSVYRRIEEKLNAHPGVVSSSVALMVPLNSTQPFRRRFLVERRPLEAGAPAPLIDFRVVGAGYFQTMGIPVIRGRVFTAADSERSAPVALVNESLARQYWGSHDPTGHRVSTDGGRTWLTIVGVTGDVRQFGLDQAPAQELYVPVAQAPFGNIVLLRTRSDPALMSAFLRQTIRDIDPRMPVDAVRTLREVRIESLASPRLTAALLAVFASLAVAITAAGIGGMMALVVSQRKQEIGIRLALGATPAGVLAMVLGQGMRLLVAGLLLGVVTAAGLTRVLKDLLFQVEPTDVVTLLGVALLLTAFAAAACLFPARRAASIDPMLALRSE